MPLSPTEFDQAQAFLQLLTTNEKYAKKNYLFLQPFDVSQTPGYMETPGITKKLDMQTIQQQLTTYENMDEFWKDVTGVYENAILYHGNRESKWIAKMAKDMLKVVAKERKKLAGSSSGATAGKIKIRLPTASPTTEGGGDTSAPAPKRLKLKLATSSSTGASAKKEKTLPVKAKPTQAKLKLKLSMPKKPSEIAKPPTAEPASAPPVKSVPPPSTSKTKLTLKLGGSGGNSRGKELPKGVVAPSPAPSSSASSTAKVTVGKTTKPSSSSSKKSTASSTTKKTTTTSSSSKKGPLVGATPSSTVSSSVTSTGVTGAFPVVQACKVVSGLKRRENKSIAWFLKPVSDKAILKDYRQKIKHPMDISTIVSKLEMTMSAAANKKRNSFYSSVPQFVLDLRRIFANCLIYNTSIKDSLRPVAVEVLQTAEDLLKVFIGQDQTGKQSYPPLLYCWKLCVNVLDTLYNLVNPDDGQPTALYFLHPVSYYCGGVFPPDYVERIAKPMDFGTITANLLEARYRTVEEFSNDCRLVLNNCKTYYGDKQGGKAYIDYADRLNEVLSLQLDQLARYAQSSRGKADEKKSMLPVELPQPSSPLLLSVLEEMRALTYTDKGTKITEPAMGPFEKPVSLMAFPDYTNHVQQPMDLQTIEKKCKASAYATPEDFEYDMDLMFKNCEVYNSQRGGDHLVAMARYGSKQFRRLYYSKMKGLEDPNALSASEKAELLSSVQADKSTSMANVTSPMGKKLKPEAGGVSKGKTAPRISITAAQVSSAALSAARSKSPSTGQKKSDQSSAKLDQPVPLHIAIARVKEAFPLRRAVKSLQAWEADCARYFKELMRHPWISAARPKFIFHVPVPTLFPELREAYAAKIRKPMDLTTVECTLLAGNRYAGPEDFIQDVALVFANAIRFNKDGRDIGDPLSCAYYDASVHLLRYSRWLSLEVLSSYVDQSSEHVDDGEEGLPPFSWTLTGGNKKRAREEMENLVLNEPIEKSIEGDRYTWQEAECEKLLKSLRHQSDAKQMSIYIQTHYPPDYSAFIAKPMDWEKVNRTLKRRHFDKFGDVIDSLRLIFSNAMKYNGRFKGTATDSGRAYESAVYMSAKLEVAINKMILSVSDRLERERIDHANAEREIEAAERAEEARIREAWKRDPNQKDDESSSRPDVVAAQKIRLVRRQAQRRESADFEIPFFDEEDNGQHERSYFEVVKFQKSMFEKQRSELSKMRACASAIGTLVYTRLFQHNLAEEWEEGVLKKLEREIEQNKSKMDIDTNASNKGSSDDQRSGSAALNELEREGRARLKVKLAPRKKTKGTKRKHPALTLE